MNPASLWPHLASCLRNLHPGTRRRNRLTAPFAVVASASAEVDRSMQDVEAGFLEIGSILESTVQIEQNLVTLSRHMLALAEGPDGGTASIEQAAATIWRGIEFAESSDQQVVDFIARLIDTSRKIRETLPAQQSLKDALTPLKYVQILFRVESASLPTEAQSTFLALNTEITRICERVETGFKEKFDVIASIGVRLDEASTSLRLRQIASRQQLDALRTHLEKSIGSVKADYTKNQARDARMETIVPQVKRETGCVVMSLQAQDMLNQKLQHLNTILREMSAAHAKMPEDRIGSGRTLRFIEQAGRLVTAQLDVMKAELATAGSQVGGGLGKIIDAMSGIKQDFDTVQCQQAEDITIDGGIQNLIEALENVSKLISSSQDLVTETHRTIEPIRGMSTQFTRFMRELTLDIHLIGLNAEVQSAHVAQGTGLEVVSARATEVSITTCRLSEQLATDIDRITGGLGELIDAFGVIREKTESFVSQLTEEARADEDRLHRYRDQTIDLLLKIGEQLPLMEAQIGTAMSHADFSGAAVTQIEALHAAMVDLQTTAATTADSEGVSKETTGLLDQFLKGYTMQSQVEVHQHALGPGAAALNPRVADGTAASAGGAASGDIDLFGFHDLPAVTVATAVPEATAAGDVDFWGDDPVVTESTAGAESCPSPASRSLAAAEATNMDVELWGDDPVSEPAPTDKKSPHHSAA